jgi:hypothetical protein
MIIVTSNLESYQNETKSGRLPRDHLGNSNRHSCTDDFELVQVLSINDSFLIYEINIVLHISLSNSDSTANSLFHITTWYLNQLVRCIGPNLWGRFDVNLALFSFSFSCFTMLVLCGLAVRACRRMLQELRFSDCKVQFSSD